MSNQEDRLIRIRARDLHIEFIGEPQGFNQHDEFPRPGNRPVCCTTRANESLEMMQRVV